MLVHCVCDIVSVCCTAQEGAVLIGGTTLTIILPTQPCIISNSISKAGSTRDALVPHL